MQRENMVSVIRAEQSNRRFIAIDKSRFIKNEMGIRGILE
jgi:hypothetical protein